MRQQVLLVKLAPEPRLRVQDLKSQITELEQEMESLSRSLENQKTLTAEGIIVGQQKVDELLRELQKKVRSLPRYTSSIHPNQIIEIDQLRAKLKRLDDYDEIKRELEIMKVSFFFRRLLL